jgi:hypothetical protein
MHIFINLIRQLFAKTDRIDGIRLAEPQYWIVDATHDAAAFYRALIQFSPEGAIVCLEGATESNVPALLQDRRSSNPTMVAAGTIWPKSDFYHVDATSQNLEDLADMIEQHGIAMPAIHTHLYRGEQMLLEWYDAFADEPFWVSGTIDESVVGTFANGLGSSYRKSHQNS